MTVNVPLFERSPFKMLDIRVNAGYTVYIQLRKAEDTAMTFNQLKEQILIHGGDRDWMVNPSYQQGCYMLMEMGVGIHVECGTAEEIVAFIKG